MSLRNPNPLPSITKEISMQDKRLRTLNALEGKLSAFARELKHINSLCPFGADSLEVQTAVNTAQTWCDGFSKYLVEVSNFAMWSHSKAMKVLATNENILDPEELVEDRVAIIKTHLGPELEASRAVRKQDSAIQKSFEAKLKSLELDFKNARRLPTKISNRGNEHYPVVD